MNTRERELRGNFRGKTKVFDYTNKNRQNVRVMKQKSPDGGTIIIHKVHEAMFCIFVRITDCFDDDDKKQRS